MNVHGIQILNSRPMYISVSSVNGISLMLGSRNQYFFCQKSTYSKEIFVFCKYNEWQLVVGIIFENKVAEKLKLSKNNFNKKCVINGYF